MKVKNLYMNQTVVCKPTKEMPSRWHGAVFIVRNPYVFTRAKLVLVELVGANEFYYVKVKHIRMTAMSLED